MPSCRPSVRVTTLAVALAFPVALLAGAPSAVAHPATPTNGVLAGHRTHLDVRSGAQTSQNWSGYIQSGGAGAYGSASGSWTVPSLATQSDGYSSTWVGIDGATSGDGYLIQTGTEADVVDGQTQYDAWWEVITPSDEAPETVFSNLAVSPGDHITANVAKAGSGRWTMSLDDTTTGQTASHTASYAGPGESAEWIQEDTDVNGDISAAPDWHSVSFSGVSTNGQNADLQASQSVDIVDSQGTQETSTSDPSGGNAFTVTWLAAGTPTPTD